MKWKQFLNKMIKKQITRIHQLNEQIHINIFGKMKTILQKMT